jgi:hypothetical protein
MHSYVTLTHPVYIERCGTILSRGEVQRVRAEAHSLIETWSAHRPTVEWDELCALEYPGGSPHARETIELCRRLATPGPGSDVTLVYVHRGHQCPCKTPLLQTLLAALAPCLHVHGLRVEQEQLPLDTVLFAVAALQSCDRCVIVKDNAVRLGTTEVAPLNTIQCLVLSRSSGPWAIDSIVIEDRDPAFLARRGMGFLDTFSTETYRAAEVLSLASRATSGRLGIITIARTGASNRLAGWPPARKRSNGPGSRACARLAKAKAGQVALHAESGGTEDA